MGPFKIESGQLFYPDVIMSLSFPTQQQPERRKKTKGKQS